MSAKLKSKSGLKDYLLLMASLEALEGPQEAALLRGWRAGSQEALRELVESYLPRVVGWAAARRGEGFSFQELIGLGNCALMDCVKSYKGLPAGLEAKVRLAVQTALDTALKIKP